MAEIPTAPYLPPPPPPPPYADLPTTSVPFSPSASRSRLLFRRDDPPPRHFLDSCSLCRKPLARNRDIFMYKGDVPFCSEDCRQEQIDADEARDRRLSAGPAPALGLKRRPGPGVARVGAAGVVAAG